MNVSNVLLIVFVLFSCKQNNTEKVNISNESIIESRSLNSIDSLSKKEKGNTKSVIKTQQLEVFENEDKIQDLIIDKHLFKENEKTILDFDYPILNENLNKNYNIFNTYIKYEIVGVTGDSMLENEEFISLCDSVETKKQKSVINYITKENIKLLSTVFVIENYYSGAAHNSVHFKTVNYNFVDSKIIDYSGYFQENSEESVLKILNSIIKNYINSGEIYYDCWEISKSDFETYKNNFAIDGKVIKFYFDDCVICPSYTGTYYIEVNKKQLYPYIKTDYYIKRNFKEIL